MIRYIGIHGPKRVGKDSFANEISMRIGVPAGLLGDDVELEHDVYVVDRLAHPLYVWVSEITGIPVFELMGPRKDEPLTIQRTSNKSVHGITSRQLLLDQGMFVRGKYGNDFLNQCLIQRAHRLDEQAGEDLWVFVADVRTDAEAEQMDLMFDLTRDGCSYDGSVTECQLTTQKVTIVPIHLKNLEPMQEYSEACDFDAIYKSLLLLKAPK